MEPNPSGNNVSSQTENGSGPKSSRPERSRILRIPDHELIRPIGEGSYGQVWLARSIIGRWRAVKVVFRDAFKDERPFNRELSGIRRFEPISRSHEGFVDVLHVGINEQLGYFYYVMELADDQVWGQAIDPQTYSPDNLSAQISKRGRLPLAECLRFALQLSHALAELHNHGLIHRDIKPSNIIFVDGAPKLADIGLVADIDESRSYVGTEGFIPPEGPGSPQADVYSLGKVLYEASTGKDRLDFPELPPAWSDSSEYHGLLELNEIILRACHHEPARRYTSAWDMHADLVLVLNGKSVKKLRLLERRLKTLKRVFGLAALLLAISCAIAYQVFREWRIADEAHQRQVNDNVSYGNRAMDSGDLLGALPYFAEALRLEERDRELEPSYRLRFSSTLAQCPKPIQVWFAQNPVHYGQFSPDGQRVLLAGYFGKAEIHDLKTGRVLSEPFGPAYGLSTASFSPDGRFVVTASQDHTAIVWDVNTLSRVHDLPHRDMVFSANFSPDGSQIVTGCLDGWAYVWDASTGRKLFALGPYSGGVSFADFSRDGRLIAVTGYGGDTGVWQAATAQALPLRFPHNTWVVYASFSPDGERLVVASTDHKARVWDLTTGKRVFPDLKHDDVVRSAEYSPDGRLILTASFDGTARLWRAEDLQPIASNPVLRHGERVAHASFAPDARLILTTCTDGSARVWDLATCLLPAERPVGSLCRDASRLVTITNASFQVWDTLTGRPICPLLNAGALLETAQLSEDGKFALTVSPSLTVGNQTNHVVRVWDVTAGKQRGGEFRLTNGFAGAALSPDSMRLVTWSGPVAQVWDVAQGRTSGSPLEHGANISSGIFSPAGDRLALVSGSTVSVWNGSNGHLAYAPLTHPVPVTHLEFSRDGRYMVTCCADNALTKCFARVWDAASGRPVSPPLNHDDGVLFASFSPDGKRVVTAGEDFTARVWETATGRPIGLRLQHANQVPAAQFSPDGEWLATASKDGSARVWDPERNAFLSPGFRHFDGLINSRFLPDGRHLAVTDKQNHIFVWDLTLQAGPANDLVELAEFLSGGHVSASPAEGALNPPVRWEKLNRKFANVLAPANDRILRWHEWQVEQSEAEGDWFAARFHLQQLLKLRPNDAAFSEHLARLQQQLKH